MNIFYRTTILFLLVLILIINLLSFEVVKNIIRPYLPVSFFIAKNSIHENLKYNNIYYEPNEELIKILKNGNNTIFIRHSHKKPSEFQQAFDVLELNGYETDYISLNNCLTDRGKEEAKFIGILFKKLNLELGSVYSSPICRCIETANIAFEKYITKDYLAYMGIVDIKKRKTYKEKAIDLFYEKPKKNFNKIIIAHGSTPKLVGLKVPNIGQSAIIIYNHEKENVVGVLEFNKLVHAFYID